MPSASVTESNPERPNQERASAISTVPELPSIGLPSGNGGRPRRRRRVHIPDFSVGRHEEQPSERLISDKAAGGRQVPSATVFWWNVVTMYQYSHAMVSTNRELSGTDIGKEWLGILDRRIEWMKEDEKTLMAAMMDNWLSSLGVDDAEMKQICRREEDRLRRLQKEAIYEVAAKHVKATEEIIAGLTYDKKVQSTLRAAYEKCSGARKAFVQEVDKAKAKAQP